VLRQVESAPGRDHAYGEQRVGHDGHVALLCGVASIEAGAVDEDLEDQAQVAQHRGVLAQKRHRLVEVRPGRPDRVVARVEDLLGRGLVALDVLRSGAAGHVVGLVPRDDPLPEPALGVFVW
jgi:hypothetical protein